MATAIGDLVINLGARTGQFSSAMSMARGELTGFAAQASGLVGRIRGLFSGIGSVLGLKGLLLGGGIAATIAKVTSLAGEQAKQEKKLAAVLAATGYAAGFSADELKGYAGDLQRVTNFGDEATISMMAVLATFRDVKGDVFKDAVALIQDMSSVLGQDMQAGAIQVGKALADPLKGLIALRRVGVMFSEEQKRQIANYMAQKDLVGAQRVILDELRKEFGGASKAMASPLTQMRNAVGDLGEAIGFLIRPALKAMASAVQAGSEAAIEGIRRLRDFFYTTYLAAGELFESIRNSSLVSFVAEFGKVVAVGGVVIATIAGIAYAAPMVGSALATAFTVATGPIGLMILAAGALGAAIVNLTGEGETFGERLQSTLGTIPGIIDGLLFTFRNFGDIAQVAIIDLVLAALDLFPQMERPIANAAVIFIGVWSGMEAFFRTIVDSIIGGLKEIANFAKAVGAGLLEAWSAVTEGDFANIAGRFGEAFTKALAEQTDVAAPNAFEEFKRAYGDAASEAWANIQQSGGAGGWLRDKRQQLLDDVSAAEAARNKAAEEAMKKAPEKIPTAAEAATDGAVRGTKLAGAAEYGTKEGYSALFTALGAKDKTMDKVAEATAKTADATERIADAVENGDGGELIDIPS